MVMQQDRAPAGPNLFLVGAPKCGTTSLYEYLQVHPQIFFPHSDDDVSPIGTIPYVLSKEPNYFCRDILRSDEPVIRDEREYLALYAESERYRWRGDASSFYLYAEHAPAQIKEFCAEARIIITLRPPLEQMRSMHKDYLGKHMEDIEDFHDAVNAWEDRRNGLKSSPRGDPILMDYVAIARFADQVARYQLTFGRERVHVVLLEDMYAHSKETYRSILEFLEIDPDFTPSFRIHNERPIENKLEYVLYLIHSAPGIRQISDGIFPYRLRRRVVEKVRSLHARHVAVPRDPRDDALRERCRPDVERLAKLIDRNLSHWL